MAVPPCASMRLHSVAACGAAEVDAAVASAERRFAEDWRWRSPRERGGRMRAVAARIREHVDELAELEAREIGKPRRDGLRFDVSFSHAGFDYFADSPAYVRLVRREAIDGGAHLGIDLAAVLRPMFDLAVDYFQREMTAGTFRQQDAEQLLITGYGALLSYFSDAPFLGGLLDIDPLDPRALEQRRDHVLAFFHAALVPAAG